MPHLTIEYSANLEHQLDLPQLIETLHDVTAGIEAFPLAGLRTRAERRAHYRIADGHPDNSFIHLQLKIGAGRELAVKEAAGETIFAAFTQYLAPISAQRPLAISFEIVEFDPVLNYKTGNIRDYLATRQAS